MLRDDLLEAGEMGNFCKTFSSDVVVEITKYTFLNMFFFSFLRRVNCASTYTSLVVAFVFIHQLLGPVILMQIRGISFYHTRRRIPGVTS